VSNNSNNSKSTILNCYIYALRLISNCTCA